MGGNSPWPTARTGLSDRPRQEVSSTRLGRNRPDGGQFPLANRENRPFRSPTPRGFQHPIWHEPARRGAIPLGQPREPAFPIAHAKRFPAPDLARTGQTGGNSPWPTARTGLSDRPHQEVSSTRFGTNRPDGGQFPLANRENRPFFKLPFNIPPS